MDLEAQDNSPVRGVAPSSSFQLDRVAHGKSLSMWCSQPSRISWESVIHSEGKSCPCSALLSVEGSRPLVFVAHRHLSQKSHGQAWDQGPCASPEILAKLCWQD